MQDLYESESSAFVGVAFSNQVIYNIVDKDGEFEYTGLSIIQYLKNKKNEFISKIILSQSYDGIKFIFDDEIKFNDFYDHSNTNIESFQSVYSLMNEINSIDYFYIYDVNEDVLIVKTPDTEMALGVDYHNNEDVRNFRNTYR